MTPATAKKKPARSRESGEGQADKPVGESPPNVVAEAQAAVQADREAAQRGEQEAAAEQIRLFHEYVAILYRRNSPLPTDGEELIAIVKRLGFASERIASDVAVLQRVDALEKQNGQIEEAAEAKRAIKAEIEQLERQLKDADTRLTRADVRLTGLKRGPQELHALRLDNRKLFPVWVRRVGEILGPLAEGPLNSPEVKHLARFGELLPGDELSHNREEWTSVGSLGLQADFDSLATAADRWRAKLAACRQAGMSKPEAIAHMAKHDPTLYEQYLAAQDRECDVEVPEVDGGSGAEVAEEEPAAGATAESESTEPVDGQEDRTADVTSEPATHRWKGRR